MLIQTNGLTERFNQTLSGSLAKLVNEEQDDWDVHLETILCAYRASKQKSTGYSPFYMMFHRHPRLPIDTELKQSESEAAGQVLQSRDHEAFIAEMLQVQDEICAQACKNIEEAQHKQKEYYDRRHLPEVRNIILAAQSINFTYPFILLIRRSQLELRYWWKIPSKRTGKEES